MGDKGKGKDSGKGGAKKPKSPKQGLRPHELRQQEASIKVAPG